MAYNVRTSNVRKEKKRKKEEALESFWRSMDDDSIYGEMMRDDVASWTAKCLGPRGSKRDHTFCAIDKKGERTDFPFRRVKKGVASQGLEMCGQSKKEKKTYNLYI